jgi:smad nuclear-interacting protein 1
MDLESRNGTYLDGDKIESSRYYEIKDKDMVKFGHSDREYIFLKEN